MLIGRPAPLGGRHHEAPRLPREASSAPASPFSSPVPHPLQVPPAPSAMTVRAGNTLPRDLSFGPFPEQFILGRRGTDFAFAIHCTDTRETQFALQVTYSNGTLHCEHDPAKTLSWMPYIRAARDRHEQNVDVTRDSRGQIVFRCLREISRGEELFVWYSDELSRRCGIPVLSPANIRGDSEYMCNRCLKTFRFPNTLKAHMHYHCLSASPRSSPRQSFEASISGITSPRLAKEGVSPDRPSGPRHLQHAEVTSAFRPHQQLSPECRRRDDPSPHGSSPSPSSKESSEKENLLRPGSKSPERSMPRIPHLGHNLLHSATAFSMQYHPLLFQSYLDKVSAMTQYNAMALYGGLYGGISPYCCNRTPPSMPPTALPPSSMYLPGLPFPLPVTAAKEGLSPVGVPCRSPHHHQQHQQQQHQREEVPSPSQMPAINRFNFPLPTDKEGEPLDLLPKSLYSSKSPKGHMCIYCGKLYSRKYGLKIHLRTHTGYKPLKCKVCQRPFGDPSNLNKHIRLHAEGATPYRCPHCGKVLVRRRDLERHIRSRHPNEGPDSESDGVKTFIGEEEGSPAALSDISDADPLDESFCDDNQEIQVDV